jgi:hypothetical protein
VATAGPGHLSLTLTFLSLISWVLRDRALGAVLAIPLTLLTKALLLDVDPNTRWISDLITGGPAPPEDLDASETSHPERAGDPGSDTSGGDGHKPVLHRAAVVMGSSAQTLLPFSVGVAPHARLTDATRNRP